MTRLLFNIIWASELQKEEGKEDRVFEVTFNNSASDDDLIINDGLPGY